MPTGDSTSIKAAVGNQRFTWLLVFAFACLSVIGVTRHEMWRDELQAWTIARDSSSVVDLWRNMRVENHPMLWHSLLFVLTRFTRNPAAMQYLHWLIAVTSVYLFVRYSPFTRSQKILFCFGYYPLYEYCAISRNYSLCMLLLFVFCLLVQRQPRHYIALACVIGLLACSHFYDWAIVLTLVVVLTFHYVRNPDEREHLRDHRSAAITGTAIVLFFQAWAVAEAWNYYQYMPAGKWLGFHFDSIATALSFAWGVFFPIPLTNLETFFWNTNFVADMSPTGKWVAIFFSSWLLVLFLVVFWRRDRRAFLLYALGSLLLWAVQLSVGFGTLRHMGKHYLLLLTSWWLASTTSPGPAFDQGGRSWDHRAEQLANRLITAILAVQLIAGVMCWSMDVRRVFSAAKPTVQFLVDNRLADKPVVVSPDALATSISAYLGRKVYAVDSERMQGFTSWDSVYYARTNNPLEIMPKTIRLLSGATNDVILITGGDMVVQEHGNPVSIQKMDFWTNFRATKLAQFSDTLIDEICWIYLVERISDTQSTRP